jgi:transposase-like protein
LGIGNSNRLLYDGTMMTEAKADKTMSCADCSAECRRFGKHRNGLQGYCCPKCGKTYTEEHERPFRIEDYLNDPRGLMALQLLLEGCSVRTPDSIETRS